MDSASKKSYSPPRVLQVMEFELENNLLSGSQELNTEVYSTGQEVVTKDFDSGDFNFNWEE